MIFVNPCLWFIPRLTPFLACNLSVVNETVVHRYSYITLYLLCTYTLIHYVPLVNAFGNLSYMLARHLVFISVIHFGHIDTQYSLCSYYIPLSHTYI